MDPSFLFSTTSLLVSLLITIISEPCYLTNNLVFDPEDDEASQEEFKIIFKEYKEVVDLLLGTHMKELEISPEQFETACEEAEGILSNKLHQTLFEQIWAANDFAAFKRMMIQINIDLQLWALEILASRYGIIPASFLPEGTSSEDFLGPEDDFFLKEAKRRSLMENEIKQDLRKLSLKRRSSKGQVLEVTAAVNEELQDSLEITIPIQDQEMTIPMKEESNKSTEMKERNSTKKEPLASKTSSSKTTTGPLDLTPDEETGHPKMTIREVNLPKVAESPSASLPSAKRPPGNRKIPPIKKDMDPDEIKHRQEYLRSQRDKLLGLKKQERDKQLARIQDLERTGKRPQTAKFMAREAREAEAAKDGTDQSKALPYARSLAARIKAEVADDDEDKKSK